MGGQIVICPACGFKENSVQARFCVMCAQPLPVVCGACGTLNPSRFRFCALCYAPLTGYLDSSNAFQAANSSWELPPLHSQPAETAPIVGRETLLQEAEAATLLLDHGLGGVIAIVGEMGVGVSRFTEALIERIAPRPLSVLQVACFPFSQRQPYGPFVALLTSLANIHPSDSAATTRAKIEQLTQTYSSSTMPNLGLYLEAMVSLELLESEQSTAVRHLEPLQFKRQIFFALRELLRMISREYPLVIVVEDLHWADSLTLETLEYLIDAGEEMPLQLVLTMRSPLPKPVESVCHSLMTKAAHRGVTLHIERLSAEALHTIVTARIPQAPVAVIEAIVQASAGLPFHADELVRSLLALEIEPAALTPALVAQLPTTLLELLQARFEQLPEVFQATLTVVAGMGLTIWSPVLHQIETSTDPLSRLQALCRDGWLKPSGMAMYWTFVHPLMQEIIYATLTAEQRQALHSTIGLVLEKVSNDRRSEHVEPLAYHFLRSTHTGKAAFYGLCAAERAINRCLSDAALAYYAAVEAVVAGSIPPLSHETAEVALGQARILTERNQFSEALAACRMGLDAIGWLETPDPALHAALERQVALINKRQSRFADAQKHFAAAREVLGDGTLFDHALLDADAGLAALQAGDIQQAEYLLHTALTAAETQQHLGLQMRILNRLAQVYQRQGDPNQASLLLSRRLLLGRRLNDLGGVAQTLNALGELALERSDWADAQAYYRESTAVFATLGDITGQVQSALAEAQALMMLGALDRALRVLRMAYTLARQLGDGPLMVQACFQKARILFFAGDLIRARQRLIEAVTLLWPLDLPNLASEIAGLLARIACANGRMVIAQTLAHRAWRLANPNDTTAMIHALLLQAFLALQTDQQPLATHILETLKAHPLPPYDLAHWWLLSAQMDRLNNNDFAALEAEKMALELFEAHRITPILRRF